jgi:hypothetical protein
MHMRVITGPWRYSPPAGHAHAGGLQEAPSSSSDELRRQEQQEVSCTFRTATRIRNPFDLKLEIKGGSSQEVYLLAPPMVQHAITRANPSEREGYLRPAPRSCR